MIRDNDDPFVAFVCFCILGIFSVLGVLVGSELSENGNITQGRNQGIVFCTEKPKECAVEYSYIKLKETQK